ncbi:MAG TPA: hypothetical protein VFC82_02115 [Actinomycetaceae bacterium]|nr:hypothetical protein [Actinomycetaceae bacterium]
MSESEKKTHEESAASPDEGVALSPYDSDLRSPEDDVTPEEMELATPAGYDEAVEHEGARRDSDEVEAPEDASQDETAAVVADTAATGELAEEAAGTAASTAAATAILPMPSASEEQDESAAEWQAEFEAAQRTDSADASETAERPVADMPSETVDQPTEDGRRAEGATEGATAAGAAATAAVTGAAAGRGRVSADAQPTDTFEPDAFSNSGVQRTSLLHQQSDVPSNEPTRLRESVEADPRVENYGTTLAKDDTLFDGAEYDRVPSRVGAHIWGIVAMLLLIPIAWYLLSDAGARMTLPANAPWETGTMNIAALAELLAGLVVLVVALLFARASSVGAFVVGSILALGGAVFVAVPGFAREFIAPAQDWLRQFHAGLGGNIAHHIEADGSTGRILIFGVILLMIGVVSHGARRRGRDEQRIRAAVERRRARLGDNPQR